jgi:zinc protease
MKTRAALVAIALAVTSCGSRPTLPPPPIAPPPIAWPPPLREAARSTPDAPFRDHVPEPGPAPKFTPPQIVELSLKNGVRVLFAPRHDLPIVSVRLVLKTGAGDFSDERREVMVAMGSLLEQGTTTRTALQISDEYESLGASHAASVGWDSGGASIKVIAAKFEPAVRLMADIALHPSFPDAEIERWKASAIGRAQQQKTNPAALAQSAIAASVFGHTHPYGRSPILKEAEIHAITSQEIRHAYEREFTAKNAAICVSGDVTREALLPILEHAFGEWKSGPAHARSKVQSPPQLGAKAARIVIVDRPKAPQTQVYLAEPGISMNAPDRDATLVMNAILGGMFSSRINLNLREAHAYTYGAHSSFAMRHGAGAFQAGGAIIAINTAPAVTELFKEVNAMRDADVSPEELADAKESMLLAMPGRFETVSSVTDALADIAVYDLPIDEYARRVDHIKAVTRSDVRRAAKEHLHPGAMRVVVVGDRTSLTTDLGELHLGAIETRDAYGDLLP